MLGAAFVLSAFTAVAFAETPEWLAGGKAVSGELAAETSGELELSTLVLGIRGAAVLCSGILDGEIGPLNHNLVTKVLNLAGEETGVPLVGLALSCSVTVSFNSACGAVGGLAEVWPVNLPWASELLLMTTAPEWLNDITQDGSGNPGWYVLCSNGKTNECTGSSSTSAENETGGVFGEFNTEGAPISSEKAKCTEGGEGAGDIVGGGLTTLNNKEALTIS